jgi:hypothetical protein
LIKGMTSNANLANLLSEMASLLESYGNNSWAIAFERLAREAQVDEAEVLEEARGMFGGMGSLSDIVLHGPDASPLRKENDRFDELRRELYRRTRA